VNFEAAMIHRHALFIWFSASRKEKFVCLVRLHIKMHVVYDTLTYDICDNS
jgi:hypothetical protein